MSHTDEDDGEAAGFDDDFKKIAEANFKKIQSKAEKIGYADGIADGEKKEYQSGFDLGYAAGYRTGFELEVFKSFFENLNDDDEELLNEKTKYNEMNVAQTLSKDHCKQLNDAEKDPEALAKEQQKYMDDFIENCKKKLPLATNLLMMTNNK